MNEHITEERIEVMASGTASGKGETGGVEAFNHAPERQAVSLLEPLFCSAQLAEQVVAARPFATADDAVDEMKELLRDLSEDAILESVNAHPPIGGSVEKGSLSESEQSAALGDQGAGGEGGGEGDGGADPLTTIRALNEEYRGRFGYTFLIRAAGLTAGQILANLEQRLTNTPEAEWSEVLGNLAAINELRMRQMLESLGVTGPTLSTHVLDTSTGLPASGVHFELQLIQEGNGGSGTSSDSSASASSAIANSVNSAEESAGVGSDATVNPGQSVVESGETNADGRFSFADRLGAGVYNLRFDTDSYFAARGIRGLYPWVDVTFRVDDVDLGAGASHLHIPLLLSPYGYSTYRGS